MSSSRRVPVAAMALMAVMASLASLMALPAWGQPEQAAPATDPYGSLVWDDMRREFLGAQARTVFDARVQVRGPAFAEDPMNVPVTVQVSGLAGVQRIVVLVDRNPIRKVLEYQPLTALPSVSFRFKLEQASPVRAAVLTRDGLWHIGGTQVDSAGGGCTVPGASRKDGSWSRTLGLVNARVFDASPAPGAAPDGARQEAAARLRLRVMHPMDTGLSAGIPAFYMSRLSVFDAGRQELLRLQTFEPVSENPVLSFDFPSRPRGPLRIEGRDNNGNRIDARLDP